LLLDHKEFLHQEEIKREDGPRKNPRGGESPICYLGKTTQRTMTTSPPHASRTHLGKTISPKNPPMTPNSLHSRKNCLKNARDINFPKKKAEKGNCTCGSKRPRRGKTTESDNNWWEQKGRGEDFERRNRTVQRGRSPPPPGKATARPGGEESLIKRKKHRQKERGSAAPSGRGS